LLSKSWDKNQTITGFLNRHLRRCASCREYARFLESLHHKFTQDTPNLLKTSPSALNERIISALDKDIKPKTTKTARPFMLPALAASLAALIIVAGLIFKITPFQKGEPVGSAFPRFDIPTAPVENFLQEMESPYEEEFLDLKETMKSTAEFLISRLDVNLGNQQQ
jgi:hypothetical protein